MGRTILGRAAMWLGCLLAAAAALHLIVLIASASQESPPPAGAVYRAMGAILAEQFTGGGR